MVKQKKQEDECSCEECDETCEHEHSGPEHANHKQNEMLELNLLDMQIRQLEQQAVMIEQQIIDQQNLIKDLEELKKAKKGQSLLFPFSREIFVEGKIESPDVLVNVGSKTLVKKSIDETKKLVEKQKGRLLKTNEELHREIQRIMTRIMELEKKLNA